MKFKVSSGVLKAKVSLASSVINARSVLPVLNNVLLVLVGNQLSVVGNNIQQEITTVCDVLDAEGSGRITVPARKLSALLGSFDASEMLDVSSDDESCSLTIKTQTGSFTLVGMSPDDWPSFSDMLEDANTVTLPMSTLFRQINEVRSCVNKSESRLVLTGIFFDFSKGSFSTVATDGRRMSYSGCDLMRDCLFGAIVPMDAIAALLRMPDDNVVIHVDKVTVKFTCRDVTIRSRIVAGNYPNYRNIIPASFKYSIKVDSVRMSGVLSMLSALQDLDGSVLVTFGVNQIEFSCQSAENGSGHDVVDLESDSGIVEPISMNFNPKFLQDAIAGADNVMIRFNDGLSPISIERNEDSFTVIMPMRSK